VKKLFGNNLVGRLTKYLINALTTWNLSRGICKIGLRLLV